MPEGCRRRSTSDGENVCTVMMFAHGGVRKYSRVIIFYTLSDCSSAVNVIYKQNTNPEFVVNVNRQYAHFCQYINCRQYVKTALKI